MKTLYKQLRFLGLLIFVQFCTAALFAQRLPKAEMTETVNRSLNQSVQQYKLLGNALQSGEWPRTFKDGKLLTVGSHAWISGFYPGTLLYLYEFSGDKWLWDQAAARLGLMEDLKTMTTHHDLGFMMYSSFGNAFRLTRNPHYRQILVESARSLASRFDPVVGCIQSWDQVGSLDGRRTLKFPVIIDNMMNLELLFAASKLSGDPQYREIAIKHAETTLKNHFRPDYSSYHVVDYDSLSGAVKSKETVQGFSDNSTWARGQAWAIYGFSMTYRETGEKRFLEAAEKMAGYYLDHPNLPEDMIPYWDFNVDQEGYDPKWNYDPGLYPEVPRDASAAAIVASALIELAGFAEGDERDRYLAAAEKTIRSLSSPKYRNAPGENGGFILKHASGGVPGNIEVDVPLSYADYYYVESLMRYKKLCESAGPVPADTVLNRYQGYLFRTEALRSAQAVTLAEQLDAEGKWPDIDYSDPGVSNWRALDHLKRLRTLALAWADPRSEQYREQALKEKIDLALGHWLAERYQNDNWWYNEIGVPQLMRDILVLLRNDLNNGELRSALEVLGQLYMREDFVAGNLIWSADLGLHYGALTNDQELMRRCRNLISAELRSGAGEGIQSDYSFHQHGARLQMYQYGKAYLQESLRIAWQLRGTELAFPPEKIDLLIGFLTEGWQWMARGINTVPGTMDRSSSRKGELRSADIRKLIPFIIALRPGESDRLLQLRAWQDGKASLQGYRYYPRSDFAAYHRQGFSFFLKTISERTLATESINRENLKGKLLNSGDAYFIRNGQEYFDLLPLWDWTALPGVTTFKNAHKIERRAFVGGVSDDTSGLSVMDYRISDNTSKETVTAKKFWACYKDMVVCLTGGLNAENVQGKIYTALDQCRWQGTVATDLTGAISGSGKDVTSLDNPKWIYHSGFAYLPLQDGRIDLHLEEKTGNWNSINAAEGGDRLRDRIFKPVMYHHVGKSAWAYVVALRESPEAAEQLAENPKWEILSNNENCQAVRFTDGTTMIAFYAPADLALDSGEHISADRPCLAILKENDLYLSDPSQSGSSLKLEISGRSLQVDLPPDGTTEQVNLR